LKSRGNNIQQLQCHLISKFIIIEINIEIGHDNRLLLLMASLGCHRIK